MVMHQLSSRIQRILTELQGKIARKTMLATGIEVSPRGENIYVPFENGSLWGKDSEWWDFRFQLTIPEDFSDLSVLRVVTGREGGWDATNPQFVVRMNGQIEQAFDVNHTSLVLGNKLKPGEKFDVLLNAYAPPTPQYQALPYLKLTLEDVNEELVQLLYDIGVPLRAAKLLKEGEREREVTLEILAQVIDMLDIREAHSAAFDASVASARAYLKAKYYDVRAALPPIATAEAVGHTHIDVAWLWDLYQTRHKAVRSFSTVLKYMELYPEYKFMSSQPALYQFVKEDEPELYERIKQAIAEGRWEPEGGMWVEADCNLSSGESLARQFLYGQDFFQTEFGKSSRILWLPDVFGYSAALPQIMKLSGVDYFMTTKISWSEFNQTPYDTFMWKGIDGTEVLTHFSPSMDYHSAGHEGMANYTTYNAMLEPSMVAGGWNRYQQKGLDDTFLVTYGFGDGGGGPTDWMLEAARRMETPLPLTPAVKQQHSQPFFEALESRVKGNPLLPKWSGELYLEYHRGTYTAMARNKRSNRKIELLIRDVELWRTYAARKTGLIYPTERLDAIWRDVLTLQFHDILPGSSIKKVYDDSLVMYERMFEELDEMKAEALDVLSKGVKADVLAYNSLSHERDDIIAFDAPEMVTALRDAQGNIFPVQFVRGKAYAFVLGMAAMGATPFFFCYDEAPTSAMNVTTESFDTPFYSGAFDASMRINSLIDKCSGRQLVKEGELLNRIVCYENKPHNHDAWDINIYYDRRHWDVDNLVNVEMVSTGPVMTVLCATYSYMKSTIQQDMIFYHDIGRIDFDTTVDWKEQQYLLKAHFPVDVFYNEATFDIQYGNLKRATHKNTSWDIARFEVCAHKWVDVSEDGFGVSLLNDCKYGHSVDENSMALTLLKSSTSPNPDADQEVHHFKYSLMPHTGDWREGGTTEIAYQFNIPVSTAAGSGEGTALASFACVNEPNVTVEVVKRELHGEGIVIRLYECYGRRSTGVKLQLGIEPKSAELCNILEQPIGCAALAGNTITFDLKPYEIKSFLIK